MYLRVFRPVANTVTARAVSWKGILRHYSYRQKGPKSFHVGQNAVVPNLKTTTTLNRNAIGVSFKTGIPNCGIPNWTPKHSDPYGTDSDNRAANCWKHPQERLQVIMRPLKYFGPYPEAAAFMPVACSLRAALETELGLNTGHP